MISQKQIRHLMGLYSSGNIKESLREANKLAKVSSNNPMVYTIAGACYERMGQLGKAIDSHKRAVRIEPNNAKSHYNLANAYRLSHQLELAVSSFQKTVSIQNNNVNAHYYLGYTLWQLGQLEDSITCFQKTLKLKPDFAEAHNNLGYNYTQLDQADIAIQHFKQAIKFKPAYAQAHNNLGTALKDLGQMPAAMESYQRALTFNPNFAEVYNNLGNVFNELGDPDKSIDNYEKALRVNPAYIEAHFNLSSLRKYQFGDSQIDIMEDLYGHPELGVSERVHLGFSLAKVYDDLSDVEKSFNYLNEANLLRKKELNYNFENDRNLFSKIESCFDQENTHFDTLSRDADFSVKPIFIVGMPRSGTSLVEQIISSHSLVHGAGELGFLEKSIMPKFTQNPDATLTKIDAFLSSQDIKELGDNYLKSLASLHVNEEIITDKMPLNFRWIGFILSAFPEAKIIHLNRDPMATCWSSYKLHFQSAGLGFAYDLKDLGEFYTLYTEMMAFWEKRFPHKIYDLCYEKLTENPEEEIRGLLRYCELDFEQECIDFHTTSRTVKTASAAQVRQKIYTGSSMVWKKYAAYLEPLMKSIG